MSSTQLDSFPALGGTQSRRNDIGFLKLNLMRMESPTSNLWGLTLLLRLATIFCSTATLNLWGLSLLLRWPDSPLWSCSLSYFNRENGFSFVCETKISFSHGRMRIFHDYIVPINKGKFFGSISSPFLI
jgi:hypothetical protein